MHVPTQLAREAFGAAGEKRFALARPFYAALLGADWGHALLGFSYMKCVDNLVDEDANAGRALAMLARQRRFIEDVYDNRGVPDRLPVPERFGYPCFCFDRSRGAPLRPTFESLLATMETDTRRRGMLLSAAELDAHLTEVGSHALRFLLHFAAPDAAIPTAFIEHASRAYLYADVLMDLKHDLGFGLINIPVEDYERDAMRLDVSDDALRRWVRLRSFEVLREFSVALRDARRLECWPARLLTVLYLWTKRRSFRRFLVREGLGVGDMVLERV